MLLKLLVFYKEVTIHNYVSMIPFLSNLCMNGTFVDADQQSYLEKQNG